MIIIELGVPEDELDVFQGWLAKHVASGRSEALSFEPEPGSFGVTYKVAVSVRTEQAAELVGRTWKPNKR